MLVVIGNQLVVSEHIVSFERSEDDENVVYVITSNGETLWGTVEEVSRAVAGVFGYDWAIFDAWLAGDGPLCNHEMARHSRIHEKTE